MYCGGISVVSSRNTVECVIIFVIGAQFLFILRHSCKFVRTQSTPRVQIFERSEVSQISVKNDKGGVLSTDAGFYDTRERY